MSKKTKTSENNEQGNSSLGVVRGSLLHRAVMALDDYLNAGHKAARQEASEKAKQIYEEYFGVVYRNRNDR